MGKEKRDIRRSIRAADGVLLEGLIILMDCVVWL